MAVDWLKIKNEYINTRISTRKLAEKYGVSASAVMKKSAAEKWAQQRQKQMCKIEAKVKQRTASSVASKIASTEADRIAALTRVGAKAAAFLEKRIDAIAQSGNKAYEVKSIMESVRLIRDIYKTDEHRAGLSREDDPLTQSLREEAKRLEHQRQAEADSGLPVDGV